MWETMKGDRGKREEWGKLRKEIEGNRGNVGNYERRERKTERMGEIEKEIEGNRKNGGNKKWIEGNRKNGGN